MLCYLCRGREILEARNEAKKGELDEQLKVNKDIIIMHSYILNVTNITFSVCVREVIFKKKKVLTFGHCPKVALTHPNTNFGHLLVNFCLKRFRKNIQLKTTS